MDLHLSRRLKKTVRILEKGLALAVLLGVAAAAVHSLLVLVRMDWQTTEAFYELIYRTLLLVIGLELVRMLVTHSLAAVLELLAFVIARKMLKPDLTAGDIILSVAAFAALLASRRFLMSPSCYPGGEPDLEARPEERPPA